MENIITVVIPSRYPIEEKKDFLNNVIITSGVKLKVLYLYNDGSTSLTQLYENALSQAITDIVIFMHDDIEFLMKDWGKEIIRMFNDHQEYGIIGVAGSAEFDSNAAWWSYKNIYGQVLHRHNGRSWVSMFSPLLNEDLKEVCVIDGLFMAISKSRISKTFDTNLPGFHFYDIDFCLNNFLDGKTKIGVTTNIKIAHNSIGETNEQWELNKNYVNSKYKKYYPITVKCYETI